jgi:uncharacterized protein YodC (DUF2158 family)
MTEENKNPEQQPQPAKIKISDLVQAFDTGLIKPDAPDPEPETIALGDVVMLNSGGPRMTVSNITTHERDDRSIGARITVSWFDGDKLKWGEFAPEALVAV